MVYFIKELVINSTYKLLSLLKKQLDFVVAQFCYITKEYCCSQGVKFSHRKKGSLNKLYLQTFLPTRLTVPDPF